MESSVGPSITFKGVEEPMAMAAAERPALSVSALPLASGKRRQL